MVDSGGTRSGLVVGLRGNNSGSYGCHHVGDVALFGDGRGRQSHRSWFDKTLGIDQRRSVPWRNGLLDALQERSI